LQLDAVLRRLSERLTVTDQPALVGRINVNTASRTVLLSVPGLTPVIADTILAACSKAGANHELARRQSSLAWLVTERVCDLKTLRDLAPYVTTRGDVYRGVSTGSFMERGHSTSIEFLIDGSGARARLLWMEEL
jgi:hypothetical protein